eukprot:scaffold34719_cov241-Amphora_coffeaeformis.AAC.4
MASTTTPTTTRLYSTLRTTNEGDEQQPPNGDQEDEDENDRQKWEQLYARGEVRRRQWVGSSSSDQDNIKKSGPSLSRPIRVISFDLDNCLWKTSAVIDAANHALAAYLQKTLPDNGSPSPPVRAEVIMGELWKADRATYAPLLGEAATSPCRLTQLRQDAIREILVRHKCYEDDPSKQEEITQQAFDVWATARHDAIPTNMAQHVVETLTKLRQSLNNKMDDNVIIGAITDGNSDPMRVECLRPFFDFVVNAESVGVGKPDPRVYLQAMQQVTRTLADGGDGVYSVQEDQVGSWWVHVGDDFVKDIVAAKNMGMRTVWARELVQSKTKDDDKALATKKPERTVEDLVKQVSSLKVVQMQVGAEDYLAESLREEFADAVIDSFADLADVLMEWHAQGMMAATNNENEDHDSPLEVFYPDKPLRTVESREAAESPALTQFGSSSSSLPPAAGAVDTKFCVFCGERLPKAANFCSSCGEKQPALP